MITCSPSEARGSVVIFRPFPSGLRKGLFFHLSVFNFLRLAFKLLRSLISLFSNKLYSQAIS